MRRLASGGIGRYDGGKLKRLSNGLRNRLAIVALPDACDAKLTCHGKAVNVSNDRSRKIVTIVGQRMGDAGNMTSRAVHANNVARIHESSRMNMIFLVHLSH